MGKKDKLTSGKLQKERNMYLSNFPNYNNNDKHDGNIYNYIKKNVPSSMLNCKLNKNCIKNNKDNILNLYSDIHANDKNKIFNFPTTKFDYLFIDMPKDGNDDNRNGSISQNIESRISNYSSVNKSKYLESDNAPIYLNTLNNGALKDKINDNNSKQMINEELENGNKYDLFYDDIKGGKYDTLCSHEKKNEQNSETDWDPYLNDGSNIVTSSDIISSIESNVDTLTNSIGLNIDLLNYDNEENNITEIHTNSKDTKKGNMTMSYDSENLCVNNIVKEYESISSINNIGNCFNIYADENENTFKEHNNNNNSNNNNNNNKILYNLAGFKLTGTSIMLTDKNEKYIYKIIPFFKNGESKFYMNAVRSYNKVYGTFRNEKTQFYSDINYAFYANLLEKSNAKMGKNIFRGIQDTNEIPNNNFEKNINTINFYDKSKKIRIKHDNTVNTKCISDSIEKSHSFLRKFSIPYANGEKCKQDFHDYFTTKNEPLERLNDIKQVEIENDETKNNNILAFLIKEKIIPKSYDIVPVYQCRENKVDSEINNKETNGYFCNNHEIEMDINQGSISNEYRGGIQNELSKNIDEGINCEKIETNIISKNCNFENNISKSNNIKLTNEICYEKEQSNSPILSNTSEKWKIFMCNENKILDNSEMGRIHLALKLKRICSKIKYGDQHLLDLKLGYNSIKDNDIFFNKELLKESESIDWNDRENYIKKWSKIKKNIRKIYKNNSDKYIIQITPKDLNLPEQFYKYNNNEIYCLLKSWKQEMSSLKTTQKTLGFRICAFIYYIKYSNLLTTDEINNLYNKILNNYTDNNNDDSSAFQNTCSTIIQNGQLEKCNEKKIEINECYDKLNNVLKISRESGMRLNDEFVLYFLEIFLKNIANIILPKLVKLKIWLENQSLYTFCSTSILIIYDKNNPLSCDMRWIDFTYSFEIFNYFKNNNPINKKFNLDIIFGINNLIKICKNIIVNKNIPIPISSNNQKEKKCVYRSAC